MNAALKHTPEPWPAPDTIKFQWLLHGDDLAGGVMSQTDYLRARACVNALAGLSDDALAGGWTYAGQNAYALKLERERDELLAVLAGIERTAAKVHAHWDADEDSKVGKYLLALCGANKGYMPETDAVRAALAKHGGQ